MKRNAQRYGSLVLALAALCTTDLSARTTFSTITDVASVSQAASTNKPCQQEAKAPQLGIDPLQDVIDAMTIEEKVYLLVGAGTSATDLEANWFQVQPARPSQSPVWEFLPLFLQTDLPDFASRPNATVQIRPFMRPNSPSGLN